MHGRGRAALRRAARRGRRERAARCSRRWATASPPPSRRRASAVQAAIESQLAMPSIGLSVRMGIHTGEVETGRRRLPRPDGEPRGPDHGGRSRWPDPAVGGRRSARAIRPVRVDIGRSRRPRHAPAARPDRTRARLAADASRPAVRLPAGARRRHVLAQPADPAIVAHRPRSRRRTRRRARADAPDRHAHRGRRRRQDPAGGAGGGRHRCRGSTTSGSSSWRASPIPTTSPTRSRCTMGVGAVTDPLDAVAMMLAGTETLLVVDNCEHVVDSAASGDRRTDDGVPEPLGHRHEPRDARDRRRARRHGAVARPGDDGGRALPAAGDWRPAPIPRHSTRRRSSTSASGSTGSRSRSSSRRPGRRRSVCRRSSGCSTTSSTC